MKISDRLVKVQLAVLNNKVTGDGSYGREVGKAAMKAMMAGLGSEEWKNYMSLFADSSEQLKRLSSTELDGDDEWLPHIRAYIVANGTCAPGTDAKTIANLANIKDSDIDKRNPLTNAALSETADPAVRERRKTIIDID
jgi:hypothetical protein